MLRMIIVINLAFPLLQLSVKNCFIRGSVVRYVQLPADEVDTQLLQDAARKEAMQQKQWFAYWMGFSLGWDGGGVKGGKLKFWVWLMHTRWVSTVWAALVVKHYCSLSHFTVNSTAFLTLVISDLTNSKNWEYFFTSEAILEAPYSWLFGFVS